MAFKPSSKSSDSKWIRAVCAAGILVVLVFSWWANSPIESGSGPVEALNKPFRQLPQQEDSL